MFPLHPGNELVIQFSNSPHQHQHKISEDLILKDYDSLDVTYSDKKFGSSRPEKIFYAADDKSHDNSNEYNNKKKKKMMVHREVERQRRREMATLHASLRSLLPLEFIKGKRSISDHMNEAVNYIKYLQKNIKELSAKRDELKKLFNSSPKTDELKKLSNSKLKNHESKHRAISITVHENNGAVGVEIACGFREEGIPLSKLLELLLKDGLEVVSCLSTEVNGRLLHTVQCEVNNSNSVDLSELRRKFASVIPSYRCSD